MVGIQRTTGISPVHAQEATQVGNEGLGPGRRSKWLCVELQVVHRQGRRLTSSLGLAHRVVLDLLDDDRLKNKGYHVYMDNFYTSPALLRDLRDEGFEACGTIRSNRVGIPEDIRSAKLKNGESHFSRDDSMLFMKWKDKRDVLMLSTFHDDTFIEKRRHTRHAEDGVEGDPEAGSG